MGTSENNMEFLKAGIGKMGIAVGDTITQAQHVMFYKNAENLVAHMKKLAEFIKPRRDVTLEVLQQELGATGEFATWTSPAGGYFISVYTKSPIAAEVVALAKKLGVALTGAGAAFPLSKDPNNNHLRISFTYPAVKDVQAAMGVVCLAIKYLTLEQQG
jgi:DNA-binding transcriptional MocR family regulator